MRWLVAPLVMLLLGCGPRLPATRTAGAFNAGVEYAGDTPALIARALALLAPGGTC